jgi:hypothetical protein
VFRQHSNLRSADAELQQRASEYLQLSIIASTDVLVCDMHISYLGFDVLISLLMRRVLSSGI